MGIHEGAEEVLVFADILVLVLFGSLIVLTQGAAVAPFIYTLF